MNEVLHCLLTRRSVKKYLSQPVEEEKLEAVLELSLIHISEPTRP